MAAPTNSPFDSRISSTGGAPRFTLGSEDSDDDEMTELVITPMSHSVHVVADGGLNGVQTGPPRNGAGASGSHGASKPNRVSFNIDIDDTGDDILLDWERYARPGRHAWHFRVFGREFHLAPPGWWFHLTKGQRKTALACGICFASLVGFLLLIAVFWALGLGMAGGGLPRPMDACQWAEYRLPTWVTPSSYDLNFDVMMEAPYTVNASAVIEVDVAYPTKCIVLHADLSDGMVVSAARISGGSAKRAYVEENGVVTTSQRHDDGLEQLTLEWQDVVPKGRNTMFLSFSYTLRDGMAGFYRSTYTEEGVEESLAATQFEANSARKAFPCFDEPGYKASFTVEVVTGSEYQVLSNMPVRTSHRHDTMPEGVQAWHFEPTPPMSTYLLAIVVGKLQAVTREIDLPAKDVWWTKEYYIAPGGGKAKKRVIKVWGIPSQVENLEFAADAAATIVPFYEDKLRVAYALPKLDLVAIPDFSAGAMENWGLITYRQVALEVSPTSSLDDRRYVSIIVAHELAHQWFGNLVTMSWWNDLWLNEGFASYVEYLGADAAHPEMSFLDDFYSDIVPVALEYDAKVSSHALSTDAATVSSSISIEGVFDAIEYQKGGAVLRMVRAWMNRDAISKDGDGWEASRTNENDPFLSGLSQYLVDHSYRNSSALALWESVERPIDVDLIPLLHEWTFMDGYPMVTVTMDSKGNIMLSQQKFSEVEEISCQTEDLWWIPTAYVSSDSATQIKWGELNSCASIRPLASIGKDGWIKLNAGQYGYYRVNYSPALWQQLHDAARQYDVNNFPVLSGIDTAGLIEDSFHVVGHGNVGMDVFLEFAKILRSRPVDDAAPWLVAIPLLRRIDHLVSCQKNWSKFVATEIISPFINSGTLSGNLKANLTDFFTFSGPSTVEGAVKPMELQRLRPAILTVAGYFGISSVTKEAESIFQGIVKGSNVTLDADLREAAYNTVAKANKKANLNHMIELLAGSNASDETDRLIRAISIFDQDGVLELSLSEKIKAQDVNQLLEAYARNGGDPAVVRLLEFLSKNMLQLYEKLGADTGASRKLMRVIERAAPHAHDQHCIERIEELGREFPAILEDPRAIARSIEAIRVNMRWIETSNVATCGFLF
jgi:puromycin-sensitive aminopeptidase